MPLCEQCHGQMRLSNSFPGQTLLAASYLQKFAFLEQACKRSMAGTPPISSLRWKFEVARQAGSPSLCASVRAVPWADDAKQQLSRLAPSAASYLQTFAFLEQLYWRASARTTKATFEIGGGKTSKQPQSL